MNCYAVIDTNVLVSGLLSSNSTAATVQVLQAIFDGAVTPVFSKDMLREYQEVLLRPKFKFDPVILDTFLQAICEAGLRIDPHPSDVRI
ncbi:putative toxin-antitoxin system toxin component, PIN family [Corynebacterium poyangense]|uniref:putative toxin-antitoxin system toxin component, PIN family n=1 Tax=Corynebacterium poyangense TaxID=2684405 RepID=UPI001CCD43E0|nr:putative toxin-antitoxin system toxin component, PIN family [Corynebacterium poyangense]